MGEEGSAARWVDDGRRPRSMWVRMISGTVVSLLIAVAGIVAVRADGEPVHDVALTDGGIWVSGGRTDNWGRVNTGSHALDLIIGGAGSTPRRGDLEPPDILQSGRQVVGVTGVQDSTEEDRQVVAIDSRTGQALEGSATVPASEVDYGTEVFMPDLVALEGDTLAIVDHQSGHLWAQRLDPEGGTSIDGLTDAEPLEYSIGPRAAVTVSEDGDVMVASATNGTVVEIQADGDGFGAPERTDLPFEGSRVVDITAVGDRWVVLDPEDGLVHAEGLDQPQSLPEGGESERGQSLALAALQQPGPESALVAVQTVEGAGYVQIDRSVARSGDHGIRSGLDEDDARPSAVKLSRPAMNGDCLYAAWGRGNGVLWGSACGEVDASVAEIRVVGERVRYNGVAVRQNRGQVLLNDLDTGRIFDLSLTIDPRIDTWPGGAPRAEPLRYVSDVEQSSRPDPSGSGTKSE